MKNELALIPSSEELGVYQVMAKNAQMSRRFESLGGEAGILSIMLLARELGLPPMQALSGGMNVIQGKVEISPRMMNTMIRKAGHKLEILKSDNKICEIKGTRYDTKEEYTATFSIEDARNAGLIRTGGGWEKYPSDMLFARCLSRLARRLFADTISTAYVTGEVSEELDAPKPPEMPQKPPQEVNDDSKDIPGEVIDPSPKEPDLDKFILDLQATDPDFHGLRLEEYLYTISVNKKTGKPIPVSTVISQALKMPQRFLSSYWAWYGSLSSDDVSCSEALDKS